MSQANGQPKQKYNDQRLRFWVTCPEKKCRRKFGVLPKYVIMYLDRIARHFKIEVSELQDMLKATQERVMKEQEAETQGEPS